MSYMRKRLTFVLCCVGGTCLASLTGCDEPAARLAEEKFYKQQMKDLEKHSKRQDQLLEQQDAEWEKHTDTWEAQNRQYDAILLKWEEQAVRVDTLLNQWDRILQVLEERSGDR